MQVLPIHADLLFFEKCCSFCYSPTCSSGLPQVNVFLTTYNMQLTNNKKQRAVWRTKTKNAKLTITL